MCEADEITCLDGTASQNQICLGVISWLIKSKLGHETLGVKKYLISPFNF
jgi:hypothetical protein